MLNSNFLLFKYNTVTCPVGKPGIAFDNTTDQSITCIVYMRLLRLQLQHPGRRLFSIYDYMYAASLRTLVVSHAILTLSASCWFKYTVQFQPSLLIEWLLPVFRIHDILLWIRIRIRGSMPLTNWPSRCQQKTNFLTQFFLLITI